MQGGISGGSLNNSELMEDVIQQETLQSVSDLNRFVELCCGEFFGQVCPTPAATDDFNDPVQ